MLKPVAGILFCSASQNWVLELLVLLSITQTRWVKTSQGWPEMLGCARTSGPAGAWWARGGPGLCCQEGEQAPFQETIKSPSQFVLWPTPLLPHHLTVPEVWALVPSHATPPPPLSPVTNTRPLSHTPLHPQKLSTRSVILAKFMLSVQQAP